MGFDSRGNLPGGLNLSRSASHPRKCHCQELNRKPSQFHLISLLSEWLLDANATIALLSWTTEVASSISATIKSPNRRLQDVFLSISKLRSSVCRSWNSRG